MRACDHAAVAVAAQGVLQEAVEFGVPIGDVDSRGLLFPECNIVQRRDALSQGEERFVDLYRFLLCFPLDLGEALAL
jgi:hypothetical protein